MSKTYKIKNDNFHCFNHDLVAESFEGNPKYLGYICLDNHTVAVYHTSTPNREKGHKEYVLLWSTWNPVIEKRGLMVGGMELAEFKKHSKHSAVLCLECNTVLYSLNRHHYHGCGCKNNTTVDGGKDYLRMGGKDMTRILTGTLDVLTGKFRQAKKTKA